MSKKLYPLTNAQKSIWVADNFYPGTSQANSVVTAVIRKEINFALMNEALNLVVQHNDALRTRFVNYDGTPQQYFAEFAHRDFDVLDFSYENGERDFWEWEKKMTETPFVLIDTELFYFAMVKLGNRKNVCYFKFHHTITDAWGNALVIRKVLREYWQLENGIISDQHLEPSYIDHINAESEYLASERFNKHKEFWSGVFGTVPEFISFYENPSVSSLSGKRRSYVLSPDLSSKLTGFCNSNKVSAFSVFYALLALYISKRTNKKDIAIETPILNRSGKIEKETAGLFMHNIPTRVYVEPGLDFLTFVNQSFRELKKFMRNQRYPHSCILKDFREKNQFSGTLVDVTLNYHNLRLDSVIEYEAIWNYPGAQLSSLSICVGDPDNTGLPSLDYDYLLEVFSEEDIELMHENMCNLLQDALDNPGKKLSELQMLSQDELNKLLFGFNQTENPYEAKTVSDLFEDQVIKSPDKTAIVFGENKLTYDELNVKADQLARYIRSKGMVRNSIIGLQVKRSMEMVIGILGILKAGAAYLPIDPGYPGDRIAYMLDHSRSNLILTDRDDPDFAVPDCEYANISLSNTSVYAADTGDLNKDNYTGPDDLAYVLFTSGSTGKPKGVMVHHRALCNLINCMSRELNFRGQTIVSLTTISFDIFFIDTILPLTQGMKVIIANEEEQTIPRYLFNLITRHQVEILQVTPSRMKLILSEKQGRECLNNLSHLLITGESFPGSLLPQLKLVTSAEIYNLYGPTETTIWSTFKNVTNSEKIKIGKPIDNTQIYILDEYLSPVSLGSVGEIFIAGDGVSLGYLHNPELTEKVFLPNPFIPGKTMYRTGDLGRWLKDGEIECLGRNDNQVKIRGLRIELEEIESCLLTHPAVREAVVSVKEDGTGKKHLSAYLTGDTKLSNEDLRSHILNSLPNYMVPTWLTWLESIPLTPNGKVNRRALPDPVDLCFGQLQQTYIAPRNDLECQMAELWAEALGRKQVGIDDNIFALGGDSLTILEILSGALSYEWKLIAQDFYECPTIRQLSARISGCIPENNNEEKEEEIYFTGRERPDEIIITPADIGNVLLTGATGFLGIHLLMELLVQTESTIYCLVRGNDAGTRLSQLLGYYFPSLSEPVINRVVVINGDFTFKHFGLKDDEYHDLAQKVQTVIHCGALVKHYGIYAEFERTNVRGTCEVINFCVNFGKRLNHISTISISGKFVAGFVTGQNEINRIFKEEDFYIGQEYKTNVYIRSKFTAENQIFKAETEGLKATIFRIGVLTGRHLDGRFQRNIEENAFYRRIKSLLTLRISPESFLDQSLEFTPVDCCAKGIVNIIKVNQTAGLVFHMYNHHVIKAIEFLGYLRMLNFSVQTLSNREFESKITRLSQTKEGKEALSGFISDLVINKKMDCINTIVPDSSFTVNYLKQLGFAWPEIDDEYLAKVLNFMCEVGFINNAITYSA